MAQAPKRTRPLDRDGDGKDGGSLPGNKTAPMAKDAAPADPVDDLADARTTPGDSPEKLEAIERETDEANAAARAGDTGTEDCQECLEEFPTGTLEDGYCISCVINRETDTVSDNVADALNAIAEVEPELVAQVAEDHSTDDAYTFDAEQVEAGHVIDASDPAAPASAYRLTELQTLADSRFLYKSAQGYSPTYAAPFISEAVAQQMIKDGLATFDAQAGNSGALRPTAKARPFAAQITRNFDEAREEEASA